MILALRGARRKAKGDLDRAKVGAWLTGALSGIAMSGREYPALGDLLGETERKPDLPTDQSEAKANARAWGQVLRAMNTVPVKKLAETEVQDGRIDSQS